MQKLIEELEEMINEITDTSKIGHMKNKLAEIFYLWNELDDKLKEYEDTIKDKSYKIKQYVEEINKLKKILKVSLDIDSKTYYED